LRALHKIARCNAAAADVRRAGERRNVKLSDFDTFQLPDKSQRPGRNPERVFAQIRSYVFHLRKLLVIPMRVPKKGNSYRQTKIEH
jgi:hypothetical protein